MSSRTASLCVTVILITVPTARAGTNVWTPLGPSGAGILGLAIDPGSSSTLYVGTWWGGLYKTVDGGANWALSNTGLANEAYIAVAVSPHDSSVVFAANRQRQIYKSADGGATWALSSGGVSAAAFGSIDAKILFDPASASIVYWQSPGPGTGWSLMKSSDGGANWSPIAAGLPARVVDFHLDPSVPATLYTDLGSEGVFRSTTSGASWTARNTGLPLDGSNRPRIDALTLDPASPQTLYAASRVDEKLYASSDGGGTWTAASSDTHNFYALWVHPTNSKVYGVKVDMAGVNPSRQESLFVSSDAGATWTLLSAGHYGVFPRLVFDSGSALNLFAGLSEGLYKTTDGGTTWTAASSGLHGMRVESLAFSQSTPSTYYFGGQNGLFRTTDSGVTFTAINSGLAQPRGESLTVDPADAQTVLAGAFTADSTYVTDEFPPPDCGVVRSTNGGTTWTGVPNPAFGAGWYGLGQSWGFAWDPNAATIVYAAAPGGNYPPSGDFSVWRSVDSGTTFTAASTGLPSGFMFCSDLAAAPTLPSSTLYLGCGSSSLPNLYRSTDGATSWADIATGTALEGIRLRHVLVHPTISSTVFVGTSSNGVFKSADSGATWTASSSGLPNIATVYSLVAHASAPNTLYAAVFDSETRHASPYWSRDGGATWQRLAFGMEDLAVWVLAVDPGNANHVVAGTESTLWEITVDQSLATCDSPGLDVAFPPGGDPQSYIAECDVQINGVVLPSDPACPIDRVDWRWGDGSENASWFPSGHTYARNGGSTSVTVIGYDTFGNFAASTGELNLWDCLIAGSCGYPDTRTLSGLLFDATQTIQACQMIDVGPDFEVIPPGGDITLRAGETVQFGDGVSVANGAVLTIEIDPALHP